MAQPSHSLHRATLAGDQLTSLSGYEALAGEYYNPERHPTCANLREGSWILLAKWLESVQVERSDFCDVGCGKSILAELVAPRLADLRNIYLIDSSLSMLAYSRHWAKHGAHLILGKAEHLPLPDRSVDFLVSSLGDPYDVEAFWREAQRVVRPGGCVLYTTPSYEWSESFRIDDESRRREAEFELADGRRVVVPSYILPIGQQIALIERHHMSVREVAEIPMSALREHPISPKLVPRRGPQASVVTGYALTRQLPT